MAEIVLALYRPKPGKDAELLRCVKEHAPILRSLGLATARTPIVARSRQDGTILEVFEWASAEAVERAHSHPAVQRHWARFAACADYPTLAGLAEAGASFPGFDPVEIEARERPPAGKRKAAKRRTSRAAHARRR